MKSKGKSAGASGKVLIKRERSRARLSSPLSVYLKTTRGIPEDRAICFEWQKEQTGGKKLIHYYRTKPLNKVTIEPPSVKQ